LQVIGAVDPVDPVDPVGDGTVDTVLTGSQLFLLDSLTAGVGNTQSPTYFITMLAHNAGRLRNLFTRAFMGFHPDTGTNIASTNGTATSISDSIYSPSQSCIEVSGSTSSEVLIIGNGELNWLSAKIYFEKKPDGGTFSITEPVAIDNIDTSGALGEFGSVEIVNPTPTESTTIRLSNFTSSFRFSGALKNIADVQGSDYLDVINFAYSGQTTRDYILVRNIADWYTEMGVTDARIMTGTNDKSQAMIKATSDARVLLDDLAVAGVTGNEILLIRPNDTAQELGDMWEILRDEYNTRFASVPRIYGDLDTFETNDWMNTGDSIHTNETFNTILADEEYNLNLVNLEDALDLGVNPHYLTSVSNVTSGVILDNQVVINGAFSGEVMWYWNGATSHYFWGADGLNDYLGIKSTGIVQFTIDGDTNVSTDPVPGAGFYHLVFSRDAAGEISVVVNGTEMVTGNAPGVITIDWFLKLRNYATSFSALPAWIKFDGLHQWVFDQIPEDYTVVDTIGGNNGTWESKGERPDNPLKYSLLSDNTLLDYHYNLRSEITWVAGVNWI